MSTFLELCRDLRREAGVSGTDLMPASVLNQTGEMRKIVEWVLKAYTAIQNLHQTWDFLREDFSFSTISGTANYTKGAVNLDELGRWKGDTLRCYLTATGVSDQQELEYVPWEEFRASYSLAVLSTQSQRPVVVTVRPNQSLTFWPIPDADYTITGEYFKRAQTMTENADEPLIPEEYQEAIVWRALMYYGAERAAPEKYSHGETEYKRVLHALELDNLPELTMADPLV